MKIMVVTNSRFVYYCFFFFNFFTISWNLKFFPQIGDITIKRQEFGETIHRENFGSALNRFDGILGLSFPSEDLNFYNFSVIPTMTREKLIEKQLIAFYFNRYEFLVMHFLSFFTVLLMNKFREISNFKLVWKSYRFYKLFSSEVIMLWLKGIKNCLMITQELVKNNEISVIYL